MNQAENNRNKLIVFLLVFSAIVLLVFYWRTGVEDLPGDYHVKKANYRLEDGQYEEAIAEFQAALRKNPEHPMAHLGLAVTYMQMGRQAEALVAFDRTLAIDPEMAVAYADKGILLDRMGRYQEALANYRKALALDPKIAEGPGWLWRFLRNVSEKPPTISDRADYLESELKKSPEDRLLRVPEEDKKQRMYKLE